MKQTKAHFDHFMLMPRKKIKKNMGGSGYPTYPKFLPPNLTFFLQILNLEEKSSSAILFQLQNLEKNTYQNDHLKWKSRFSQK